MNIEIRTFEQTIIEIINQTPLPIEVKRLVVKDILSQVEKESEKVLQVEIENKENRDGNNENVYAS